MPTGKFFDDTIACGLWFRPPQSKILATSINWRLPEKLFWRPFFFFGEHLRLCPWFLASRGSVLGKAVLGLGFFCVLGLGLEPCVLDSTTDAYKPCYCPGRIWIELGPCSSVARILQWGRGCFVGWKQNQTLLIQILIDLSSDWPKFRWSQKKKSSSKLKASFSGRYHKRFLTNSHRQYHGGYYFRF